MFLDRDGVIIELAHDPDAGRPESPYDPADVRLIAGAAEGLRILRSSGYRLVVVSNQPSAAKGTARMASLRRVHERTVSLLADQHVTLDSWRYCFHHPEGVVAELAGPCSCRKPAPGLLLAAAAELGLGLEASWMIGDSTVDIEAGQRAGCRAVLIEHPPSSHRRRGISTPDFRASDLRKASEAITIAAPPGTLGFARRG